MNNPYSGYIEAASKAGLIQGYNGYFYPQNHITRQDAAVIMKRALDFLGKDRKAVSSVPDFKDKDNISPYAMEAVKLMYELDIMKGKPGNIYDPKGFTTRGEAAKIIWTFMEKLQILKGIFKIIKMNLSISYVIAKYFHTRLVNGT